MLLKTFQRQMNLQCSTIVYYTPFLNPVLRDSRSLYRLTTKRLSNFGYHLVNSWTFENAGLPNVTWFMLKMKLASWATLIRNIFVRTTSHLNVFSVLKTKTLSQKLTSKGNFSYAHILLSMMASCQGCSF